MRSRIVAALAGATLGAWLAAGAPAEARAADIIHTENAVTATASGTFEVKITPTTPEAGHEDTDIGRMLLEKRFDGDLAGTSRGQMLASMMPGETSGVYVAVERVTGTLDGREGGFMLHHTGLIDGDAQSLSIHVVPGSGTGALAGIRGTMKIDIRDGKHFYDLDYTLPAS